MGNAEIEATARVEEIVFIGMSSPELHTVYEGVVAISPRPATRANGRNWFKVTMPTMEEAMAAVEERLGYALEWEQPNDHKATAPVTLTPEMAAWREGRK